MSRIADVFLSAKHWQIFTLFIAANVFAAIVGIHIQLTHPELEHITRYPPIVLLAQAAWLPLLICWLGWLWTVGLFLNSDLEPELRLRTRFFRFALVYPVLFPFVAPPLMFGDSSAAQAVLIATLLLWILCVFYAINFVAKTLKISELRRPMIMHEYGKEFLLVFFIPLGIWLIQPRINRLYASAQDRVA